MDKKQAMAEFGKFRPTIENQLSRIFNLAIKQNLSIQESFDRAMSFHNETLSSRLNLSSGVLNENNIRSGQT